MPVDPWSIPTLASAAYENREEIQKTWAKVTRILLGKKSQLAITGMPGVGKSVLVDHFTGKAYARGYNPPAHRSIDLERTKIKGSSARMILSVIPGQESPERHESLDAVFESKRRVDGIIHVVCNGYTTLRDPAARSFLIKQGINVEKFRQQQLADEIKDFTTTADSIRRSFRRNKSRPWLIVAVDKFDLFANDDDRTLAYARYAAPGGEFYEQVDSLRSQVGTDNLISEVAPVSAWLEDFVWGDESTPSTLTVSQRDALIGGLLKMIEDRCER